MKNILKIVFVNVLSILLIFLAAELYYFIKDFADGYKTRSNIPSIKQKIIGTLQDMSGSYFIGKNKNEYINTSNFRPISGKEYNKGAIVVFGCSFANGDGLSDNETISAVLSKYTKNTVYNFAACGASPREILYLLKNKKILNSKLKNKNIDYVVYVYIDHHKNRLLYDMSVIAPVFKYNKKTDSLYFKERLINFHFKSIDNFKSAYANNWAKQEKLNNTFVIYINEINKEIKKYFSYQKTPPKFIILSYRDDGEPFWKDFEKSGITVIRAQDLIEDINDLKYRLENDTSHPNAKAWEEIVPKFVEALKSQNIKM